MPCVVVSNLVTSFSLERAVREMSEPVGKSWMTLLVVFLLLACLGTCQSLMPRRCHQPIAARPIITHSLLLKHLKIRGGSDDNDEEEVEEFEENVIEEIEGDMSSVMSTVNSITKRFVIVLGKGIIAATKAGGRAVKAAFEGDDIVEDEEEEPPSLMTRTMRTLKRMWVAAWTIPDADDKVPSPLATTVVKKSKRREVTIAEEKELSIRDFGSFLEESYSVSVDRGDKPTPVMGGTIGDALREARSKARLLVIFIPSARPGRGKRKTPDHEAIISLLSPEVALVAEKRAKKKIDSGSFVLWGAQASSPEAVTAIKRLKAKQSSSKGDKRPVLVVAYPAQVSSTATVSRCPQRLGSRVVVFYVRVGG